MSRGADNVRRLIAGLEGNDVPADLRRRLILAARAGDLDSVLNGRQTSPLEVRDEVFRQMGGYFQGLSLTERAERLAEFAAIYTYARTLPAAARSVECERLPFLMADLFFFVERLPAKLPTSVTQYRRILAGDRSAA